jgi:chemotaxis protein methyltransferase CheR
MGPGAVKFQLNDNHVNAFREILAKKLGLAFSDDKNESLRRTLFQGVANCARTEPDLYLGALEARAHPAWERVIEAVTVGETSFFRQWDHFRALTEAVLPLRIVERKAERRLRILSAGCASGEEPYSLAMLLRSRFPELEAWQVNIKGVDMNVASLNKASEGIYSDWSLRDTPRDLIQRFFRPVGKSFQLDPRICSAVTFERRNLAEPDSDLWLKGHYDIIFCRNVLMYHTPVSAIALVARLAQALVPGGFLFLGYAETLHGISQDFQLRHTQDSFYYQNSMGRGAPDAVSTSTEATPSVWMEAIDGASVRIRRLSERALEEADLENPTEELAGALHVGDGTEGLLRRAALLVDSGLCAEAWDVSEALLRMDPLSAGAHFVRALCRGHAGDLTAATREDDEAIRLDPKFAMPWLHSGLLARRRGFTDQARLRLQEALGLLATETPLRLLLFSGGFSRDGLAQLCRSGLGSLAGKS